MVSFEHGAVSREVIVCPIFRRILDWIGLSPVGPAWSSGLPVLALSSSPGVRRALFAAAGAALSACAAAGIVAALRGIGPLAVLVEGVAFPLTAAVVFAAALLVWFAVPSPRDRTVGSRPTVAMGGAVVVASVAYLAVLPGGAAKSPPAFHAAPPVRVPAQPPGEVLEPPRRPIGPSDAGAEQRKPAGPPAAGRTGTGRTAPRGSGEPAQEPPGRTGPARPRPPAPPQPVPPPDPVPDAGSASGASPATGPALGGAAVGRPGTNAANTSPPPPSSGSAAG